MSSDKIVQLSQPWRMSLEVYRGTSRRTGGKACVLVFVLVLALVQELLLVPVELREPWKMVLLMVRKEEEEGQGGAEGVLNSRNNSRNGSGVV